MTRYSSFSSKPRRPMRQMSEKRERQLDEYDEACAVVRERDRGRCQAEVKIPGVRCAGPTDPHHIAMRSRAPKLWTDPENITSICRAHHDWIHDHPLEAHEVGLLDASWDVRRDD